MLPGIDVSEVGGLVLVEVHGVYQVGTFSYLFCLLFVAFLLVRKLMRGLK